MAITLVQAQSLLDASIKAYEEVLVSQSYQKADRSLQRAMLRDIEAGIDKWNTLVDKLTIKQNGSPKIKYVVPSS
ncbi:MAG: hypothetical protein J7L21_02840 [Sulfurimonas sp.]|nr:hypothetical protein [Sulfurimonas sp.]